ncbi:two-component system sensor histidine kinase NtrB [Mesobacillus harenae]|uniref:two-component system sensor histidine kinase NtrB n=1 Tax=Mesobacillus harenae TaxID=2213203 RepID=UPI0015810DEB|nr:ATP-binding protein [Mesobacillus harenae]
MKKSLNDELDRLKIENGVLKERLSQLSQSFNDQNSRYGPPVTKLESKYSSVEKAAGDKSNLDVKELSSFNLSEALLAEMMDLIPHHIVSINKDGIITMCNLQAAQDLSVNRDDIIGRHIRELLHLPDEKILMLDAIRTGNETINEEIMDKNYGIISTKIIRDEEGVIKRVFGVFYFLNRFKDFEKQALAGRIAAGIAHEIRNPLTTVRGYLQLLQSREDHDTSELFGSLLIPEIDRANKIITDFLRLARPSQARVEYIKVRDFITEQLGKILNSESLLYNIEVDYELSPESSERMIEIDRDELMQVFINLFRNSLQARESMELTIKIATDIKNDKLEIRFSDNGPGIAYSVLEYIFDPFFTTKSEGTGLGLSVSKKIIENHGGTMKVSTHPSGTIFTILLPIVH